MSEGSKFQVRLFFMFNVLRGTRPVMRIHGIWNLSVEFILLNSYWSWNFSNGKILLNDMIFIYRGIQYKHKALWRPGKIRGLRSVGLGCGRNLGTQEYRRRVTWRCSMENKYHSLQPKKANRSATSCHLVKVWPRKVSTSDISYFRSNFIIHSISAVISVHIGIILEGTLSETRKPYGVRQGPGPTEQVLLFILQLPIIGRRNQGSGSISVINSHSAPSPLLYFPITWFGLRVSLNSSGIHFSSFPACVGVYQFDYLGSLSNLYEARNWGIRRQYPTKNKSAQLIQGPVDSGFCTLRSVGEST